MFELAEGSTIVSYRNTCVEVTSLGDHALFLGPACCRAVQVPVMGGRSMVERNCIYYSKQHSSPHNNKDCLARLDIGSCTMLSWEGEGMHHMERIISHGYFYRKEDGINGSNSSVWLLPPDF